MWWTFIRPTRRKGTHSPTTAIVMRGTAARAIEASVGEEMGILRPPNTGRELMSSSAPSPNPQIIASRYFRRCADITFGLVRPQRHPDGGILDVLRRGYRPRKSIIRSP